ncbi:MAG: hypothetical protein A2Z16_03050 [Chloroflexi bacterium RBG_16_54_18]|nr:MAG: hypothetical protein A2Z16_03050 [Chloroflexi bacterium RBG_16_54_18]
MQGDPAIRWQTMCDLLDLPEADWQAERRLTLQAGWGKRYLDLQALDGTWGGGIYSPKWISTTYTLLTLCAIGIPRDHPPAVKAAELVLERELGADCDEKFQRKLAELDRCIVGMNLQLAAYFEIRDQRTDAMVENLLEERMPDGAWNCRRHRQPRPQHSSFHTTFNVLEGLREWLESTPEPGLRDSVLEAEKQALEFVLQHRLYKSDKTGEIIHHNFTLLSYPHRWYFNVLRVLFYFARVSAPYDERLGEAVELLKSRRRSDGTWPVQHKYPGRSFFDMEKVGGPSRWNTLRALRVLKWWESPENSATRGLTP